VQEVKPVVVGVDGSAGSLVALRAAKDWAELWGCPLKVVMAWRKPETAAEYLPPFGFSFEDDARARLADAVQQVLGDQPVPEVEQVVREDSAARVLRDFSQDARMVVVGSRGHGGFVGLLLGSVSSAVAAHAACPVLVTHRAAA
jgi:nucleotide-binding universal stress UspA family protein